MSQPVLQIINDLVPEEVRADAWAYLMSGQWRFGSGSTSTAAQRFWHMDLNGVEVFDEIWELAQPMCEQVAGRKLRVIRQYANGHTYGLGGGVHTDDSRPGTHTLLYYPMDEWQRDWEGDTVYYTAAGEIYASVLPAPNRAILFDARIPHHGRAPSRLFTGLRVTVAFKLEAAA